MIRLYLPSAIQSEIVAYARSDFPLECCGLLAGVREGDYGKIMRAYPLINALASPTAFESEPRSLFQAHRAMRHDGWEWLALYHSHPTSSPIPSNRDREQHPGAGILSVITGPAPDFPLMAWKWSEEGFQPVAIVSEANAT